VSRFHTETLTHMTNGLDLQGVQLAVDWKVRARPNGDA
jgi:hypothetical protein